MIDGFDVSEWQPRALSEYKRPIDKFVILRISHGLTEDGEVAQHVREARHMNLPFAFYHYIEGQDGKAQARFAVKCMENMQAWGHKLVCDAEGTAQADEVRDFIAEAKRLLKPDLWFFRHRKRVGIYSGNWIKEHGGGTFGAQFGWLAQWGSSYSRPSGWSATFMKLWQCVGVGVDRDKYIGGKLACKKFFQPIKKSGRYV